MEIRRGSIYICIKDVIMDKNDINRPHIVAYKKDKEYISEYNGCITDEQGVKEHKWEKYPEEHFKEKETIKYKWSTGKYGVQLLVKEGGVDFNDYSGDYNSIYFIPLSGGMIFESSSVEIVDYVRLHGIEIKPILTDSERKYLSQVIRPWRDNVKSVSKRSVKEDNEEYIQIEIKIVNPDDDDDWDYAELPCFRKNEMYKGMEVQKHYSLEELGL